MMTSQITSLPERITIPLTKKYDFLIPFTFFPIVLNGTLLPIFFIQDHEI